MNAALHPGCAVVTGPSPCYLQSPTHDLIVDLGGLMTTHGTLRCGLTLAVVPLAAAFLVSCSTLPNTHANFETVPPRPGAAVIYVGRPAAGNISMIPVPVELDGQPLASLGPNDYTRVQVSPGRHTVRVPDTYWTRVINSTPHPLHLNVEPGKSYFLLPTFWAGDPQLQVTMVGRTAVAETTAEGHTGFSVETVSRGSAVPLKFQNLTYVAPGQN